MRGFVGIGVLVALGGCAGGGKDTTCSDTCGSDTITQPTVVDGSDVFADGDADTDADADSDTDTDTDTDTDADTDTGSTDTGSTGSTSAGAGCAVDRWDPADFATVYDVGPGQPYAHPNDVPWESVGADTLVRIWADSQPYAAKWVIDAPGTAADPIVVIGVCDPVTGALPVITGAGATTRTALDFWSEGRGIVKIGGSSTPGGPASYVFVEDLELRGARGSYTDDGGNLQTWDDNAAAVFVEAGDHVTLRGNTFADCGNGLFVAWQASEVTVSSNRIEDNGNVGSIYEHNSYTEAAGITFEYNTYGPLCAGCDGNNLKDRSAGTVIRYNRIEGGNRQLDLVDSDHGPLITDPRYHDTFVYGNLLIEPDGAGNSQIVHYGGDSGNTAAYRQGTLWFFHNTVRSERVGNTTLVRLSDTGHTAVIQGSIVSSAGPLAILESQGDAVIDHTWLPTGWSDSFAGGGFTGTVTDAGGLLTGADPGFTNTAARDLTLTAASPCVDAGGPLDPATAAYPVDHQYTAAGGEPRPDDGAPDLGALEHP